MQAEIADATYADLPVIVDLLNATLDTTTFEYTDIPHSLATRTAWFERQMERGFPVLVAAIDATVVGYAAYGDFRDSLERPGYRFTVEHSVHVAESHWGGGVGRALMSALLDRAGQAGVHVMVGAIDSSNAGSIRFHQRLGFVETARMPQVGRKFERWLDLVLMQRLVTPRS
jgi:L-amino acid N-acyltransferase YncA